MSSSPPDAMPLEETVPTAADLLPEQDREAASVRQRSGGFLYRMFGLTVGVLAWLQRWLIGAALCLSYLGSIVVVGWTYRWMEAAVIRRWWQKSRFAQDGSFRAYCAALGAQAPSPRPRWFVREHISGALSRPVRGGRAPGLVRKGLRWLTVPWHSLWVNFSRGLMGLTCIYLLTGWGGLLMVFGWEFGWRISYEKVYELSHVGPVVSLLGIALLTTAMLYVPMAMVHHAVTGDGRAFFDFRFVLRLIHARLTAYSGLAALFLLFSVPLTVLQAVPVAPIFFGNQQELSDAEVLQAFRTYLFCCCLFLFPVLLLLRFVAARIYASALLNALRRGTITRAELHPRLTTWLVRLQIMPIPLAAPTGILPAVGSLSRRVYAAAPYVVMVLCWLAMILLLYPKEFLVYHPILGFLNHVLVQFPTFDLIPAALESAGQM